MPAQTYKPLNILVLLNRIPYPLNDGGAIVAYSFVKGYSLAGAKVSVLAMNTAKHFVDKETINKVLTPFAAVNSVYIDNRIKPVPALLNLVTAQSYIINRFISKNYESELIRLLQNNHFDIVHIDGLPPAAYINVIRKYSKAKVVMRAHNVEHIIWQRIAEKEQNPIKKAYVNIQASRLKAFELKAIAECDAVLPISADDAAIMRALLPHVKVKVVPAGMDMPTTILNTNFNATDLFFIGSYDWMPNTQGLEWFMKNVWPSLITKWPEIKLSLAGKKMTADVKVLASNNVATVGEVPDAKQFMLQHGIMVVPIISGSGVRIKILEAISLGKTVLATTIAAEGLGLTDLENILIADTATEFINKIEWCINNPLACAEIGSKAYAFAVENYRMENIITNLLNYYKTI